MLSRSFILSALAYSQPFIQPTYGPMSLHFIRLRIGPHLAVGLSMVMHYVAYRLGVQLQTVANSF